MKKVVFLIHGFLEECNESYDQFLSLQNLEGYEFVKHDVIGHGLDDDLANFKYDLVLEHLENSFEKKCNDADEVIVMGFSMGGVLATYLASKYSIDKLILLAPAFIYTIDGCYKNWYVSNYIDKIKLADTYEELKVISDEMDLAVMNEYGIAEEHMYQKVHFMRLVELVKGKISDVSADTIAIHGTNDETVPIASSELVLSYVRGSKKLFIIDGAVHQLLDGSSLNEATSIIMGFINNSIDLTQNN